jgi:flagellar assembly protein FliH
MNSSDQFRTPQANAVETFEYQEPPMPSSGAPRRETASVGAKLPIQIPGRITPEELERRMNETRVEGIQEGIAQARQNLEKELTDERAKIAEAIRNFEQHGNEYYSRAEVELVHLSLAIAARILHREAQVDRTLVAALVKVALVKLRQGTKVIVRVHPEELASWKQYFQTNPHGGIEVELKDDTQIESHNCILETELGVTELGLEKQLKEVEQGFFDLLAHRPHGK